MAQNLDFSELEAEFPDGEEIYESTHAEVGPQPETASKQRLAMI